MAFKDWLKIIASTYFFVSDQLERKKPEPKEPVKKSRRKRRPVIARQAVIIIHGIGEQRPMDTLRDFVEAVAPANKDKTKPPFFSKPDRFSDSFELRRLTAHAQQNTFKTDYFELYWAHLMQGTELRDVTWWIWNMFVRWPAQIPVRLRWIFWVFWATLLIALGSLIWIVGWGEDLLPASWETFFSVGWFKTTVSLIVTLLSTLITGILLNYLGDAVRYFTPRPRNVPEREQIRKGGITLLRRLHEARDSAGRNLYDRIILVGHSLGSVIAYDILYLFWNEISPKLDLQPIAIDKAEAAAYDLRQGAMDLNAYRQTQFDFWFSQYRNQHSWRISDFITAGSPLALADLHLADGADKLKTKQDQREFPTCPPRTEPPTTKQRARLKDKTKEWWFSFPATDDGSRRTLHHAAPFAMTRWTNLYFKNDYVGSEISCFDKGVENQEFIAESHARFFKHKLPFRRRLPFQSHTHYWNKEEPKSLKYLKSKMQLIFKVSALPEEKKTR